MPPDQGRPHYWQVHTEGDGSWRKTASSPGQGPPGDALAALRRGIGREPGETPQMWRYYTTLQQSGAVSDRLRAEHLTLTLFAMHQQSKAQPVHRNGVGVGTAIHELRASGKFSADAVDRRFNVAATATSLRELAHHLQGLLTQLRNVDGAALDYTQLYEDLRWWPAGPALVRRRWGSQYFTAMYRADESAKRTEGTRQ